MGFANDIIGGAAALIRAAIKSPNFVHGSAGWSVNKDGSAEFNSLTIRGTFNGTNFVINTTGALFYAGTPAAGNLITSIAPAAGTDSFGNAYAQGLQVLSTTSDIRAQAAFFKSVSPNTHAVTIFQADITGTANAAANIVSNNPNFSCCEITGTETGRGSLKIAHKGYAAGSDSSAAGISIDLQTTVGGATGTQAQGLFVTSTTDTLPAGNAITIRYNSQDWFVVKGGTGAGNGIVGIGVATGHIPAGMLEIAQKDMTTPGLYISALASGTDLIQLKDSSGNLRFQVNNAGNAVLRADALFTSNAIIGSASGDFGGAGSALAICHTTDPSTNPASGHIIIYVDGSGNLLARTQLGNVRTIAAV